MSLRRGQVAVYLVVVLLAIVLLVLMNVGVFVTVRAKNKVMNAGDKAALEVAAWQGDCLNRIGALNLEHLKLALETKTSDDEDEIAEARTRCAEIVLEQRRICLLEPLEGIRKGNEAAKKLGADKSREMREILERHLAVDVPMYRDNPDLYPPSWAREDGAHDDAWAAYEARLRSVLADEMYAGPDNVEFVNAAGGHLLLNRQFYSAVAGWAWCWFRFNAPGLVSTYSDYRYWAPLPSETDAERMRARCENSEVYSLHLESKRQSALSLLGADLIMHLTGCSMGEIAESALLSDESQVWFCYDTSGAWSRWSTYSGYAGAALNPDNFPIDGNVKPEYDVKGAAAICRTTLKVVNVDSITKIGGETSEDVVRQYRMDWRRARKAVNRRLPDDDKAGEDDLSDMAEPLNLFGEDGEALPLEGPPREQRIHWSAAAKPFGTVTGIGGGASEVTVFNGFVTPAFSDVRLVPIDSVGALDLATADFDWMAHVKDHLQIYLVNGPVALGSCWYCRQLKTWEDESFRHIGDDWLKYHASECIRPTGSGGGRGGTPHGH